MKKSEVCFVLLPFAMSALNLLIVSLLLQSHHSNSQPVFLQEGEIIAAHSNAGVFTQKLSSLDDDDDNSVIIHGNGDIDDSKQQRYMSSAVKEIYDDREEEEDPMLKTMPGTSGFKAYVRADIASMYGLEPGSIVEQNPKFNGQAGKFVNMSPNTVSLWWDGPDGPVFNSNVGPWGSGGTACFATHEFIFTAVGEPTHVLCRFPVVAGTSVYYYDPFASSSSSSEQNEPDPARGLLVEASDDDDDVELPSLSALSELDQEYHAAHNHNLEFGALYKNFTGGSEWLAMYPAERPRHKMWRADHFGQTHTVVTTETQFQVRPPVNDKKKKLSIPEMRLGRDTKNGTGATVMPFAEYRAPGALNLTIKAVSCAPRAFEIHNFLSDVEVDYLLDLVRHQNLVRSTTGQTNGEVSDTRTSTTTWLSRDSDPVLNVIFRRAADVLRIDEALLRQREPGELSDVLPLSHDKINEDLQVVHYDKGQQYTAHHDFSFPKGPGNKHKTRSINLCMYLNDVPAGGQTSFPRWRNAETPNSLDVRPEKGKAMLFYMINPDGNLDDLTQHAALPVMEGEKYFVNLWISSF